MSSPINLDDFRSRENEIEDLKLRIASLSGGGPPYDGDMEKRVAKLEAVVPTLATKEAVTELSGKIDAMSERLSGKVDVLNERTQHMPTKFGMFTILASFLALFGALIVFQERIQALFGIV